MTKTNRPKSIVQKLIDVAQETMGFIDHGGYYNAHADWCSLNVLPSRLYEPGTLLGLHDLHDPDLRSSGKCPKVTVTAETTAMALRRLAQDGPVCGLNFASARHPGGGVLNGSIAQEEDLARCSTLYRTLVAQKAFYEANRAAENELYTDHIIYSPKVSFFRDEHLALLDAPFDANIITVPAPNVGAIHRKLLLENKTYEKMAEHVTFTLIRRIDYLLHVAADNGQRRLVLGAWGCGVFGNDPLEVASSFRMVIPEFLGDFDEIVFAIYDTSDAQHVLKTFYRVFESGFTNQE